MFIQKNSYKFQIYITGGVPASSQPRGREFAPCLGGPRFDSRQRQTEKSNW